MAFPTTNPIDSGWVPRNIAIDHLGSVTLTCPVCDTVTNAEQFRIIVGGNFGFGAPFFISPFLKRRSTAGKVGGTRVTVTQCCTCKSMYAFDGAARDWLIASGMPDGMMSQASALKRLNNTLAAQERLAESTPAQPAAPTRATKLPD